jgi:hypothetical protein
VRIYPYIHTIEPSQNFVYPTRPGQHVLHSHDSMASRAEIISLLLSGTAEAVEKLTIYLTEATNQPGAKLVNLPTAHTKATVRVPLSKAQLPLSTLGRKSPTHPLAPKARVDARTGTAPAAGSQKGKFCICGSEDDDPDDTFVRCQVGTGGCNGWVHLRCGGFTESEIDDIILSKKTPIFTCSLCKDRSAGAQKRPLDQPAEGGKRPRA